MLSEAEVWGLLERYCEPFGTARWAEALFSRHGDWRDNVREHVDVIIRGKYYSATKSRLQVRGAEIRLAMGVVQAVSWCRGFEPTTNPSFWRRAIHTLWWENCPQASPAKVQIKRSSFDHVGIGSEHSGGRGESFWIGLLYGTPELNAELMTVYRQLQPHFVQDSLPPLQVSLTYCYGQSNFRTEIRSLACQAAIVSPGALTTILSATLHPPPTTWLASTQLGIVIDVSIEYDALTMAKVFDLLVRAQAQMLPHLQVTIDRLDIRLGPYGSPQQTMFNSKDFMLRSRAFGQVLRSALVNPRSAFTVQTVAVIDCDYTDIRFVGAALSAVAWTLRPIEALRCNGLFGIINRQNLLFRLAWFAYALHTRHRRFPLIPLEFSLLSDGILLSDQEKEYIHCLLAHGTPLRDVIGEALRLRLNGDDSQVACLNVECLCLGSTVRLARGTRLYHEPLRVNDHSVVVTTIEEEEQVDVTAHVSDGGGFVGIVYAGYGLVWATSSCVLSSDIIMTDDNSVVNQSQVTKLKLCFEGVYEELTIHQSYAYRIATLYPLLIGSELRSLSLDCVVLLRADFALLLEVCPWLHELSLDRCVIESIVPLMDTYTSVNRQGRIARLSLRRNYDLETCATLTSNDITLFGELVGKIYSARAPGWMMPLVNMLTSGAARDVLRELNIDIKRITLKEDEYSVLIGLAQAVNSSLLRLRRLHVTCRKHLHETCLAVLGPMNDVVLTDSPRRRCAILSVLRSVNCTIPDVAACVLAMAEGDIVRVITWDSFS